MSEHISKAELDALDALEQKATKEPWRIRIHPAYEDKFFVEALRESPTHPCDIEVLGDDDMHYSTKRGDAEFIPASRNAYPRLSATLREAMEALTGIIERCWCNDDPYPGYGVRNGKKTPCENCTPARRLLESWNGEVKP